MWCFFFFGGGELWFIQIVISKPCSILTGDASVTYSALLSFSIVLLFMDHEQRTTSRCYWSISRKFFWAIRQPFPPSIVNHCKAAMLKSWIRWTLIKKITSWPPGLASDTSSLWRHLVWGFTGSCEGIVGAFAHLALRCKDSCPLTVCGPTVLPVPRRHHNDRKLIFPKQIDKLM